MSFLISIILRVACELEYLFIDIISDTNQRRISTYCFCFVFVFAVASPCHQLLLIFTTTALPFAVFHVPKNERRYSFYPLLVREDLKQR